MTFCPTAIHSYSFLLVRTSYVRGYRTRLALAFSKIITYVVLFPISVKANQSYLGVNA